MHQDQEITVSRLFPERVSSQIFKGTCPLIRQEGQVMTVLKFYTFSERFSHHF